MLKSFPPLEGNLLSIQAAFGHVYKALECSFCTKLFNIENEIKIESFAPFLPLNTSLAYPKLGRLGW